MRAAVFLDRDGVLNRLVPCEPQSLLAAPRAATDFVFLPDVRLAVDRLRRSNFLIVVVTNQPEIARGRLAPSELERMHHILRAHVSVDALYTCPHDDADGCDCRKPLPGLLHRAARDWSIALADSFLVGDSWRDIAAGRAAGCRTVLLTPTRRVKGLPKADYLFPHLPAAAVAIGSGLRRHSVHSTDREATYQRSFRIARG